MGFCIEEIKISAWIPDSDQRRNGVKTKWMIDCENCDSRYEAMKLLTEIIDYQHREKEAWADKGRWN